MKTNTIISILILAMLALSAYSYYEDLHDTGICIVGEGCSEVRHSEYSTLPIINMKLSLFGILSSTILFIILIIKNKYSFLKKAFPILIYIGALLAIYFLYTQFFIIKALCSTCISIDAMMIILAAFVFYTNQRR